MPPKENGRPLPAGAAAPATRHQPKWQTDAEALRVSEERFRLLVEHAGDDFFLHDDKGRFIDVNQRACQSTGYSRDELLHMRVTDLSIDLDQAGKEAIWNATQPGTAVTLNSHHRRKDGSVFPVEVRISCHMIDGRKLFLGMVRDITERVEAERAVRELNEVLEQRVAERTLAWRKSTDLLSQAEKLARIGSWTLDLASGEFASSDMLCEMNGADPAGPPLTAADLPRLLAPESYAQVSAAIARCIETGEPYGIDVTHLRPDGSSFAAHIRGQANRDAEGRIVSLNGTVQDISEREEARARIATLADNLPSGAIYRMAHDADGRARMLYMSAGIQPLLGIPAADIVDDMEAMLRLIHEDDRADYAARGRTALATGTPYESHFRVRNADGRVLWMQCRSAPSTIRADGSSIWDGIIRDITDERQAAEALRQAKEAAERAERAKSNFLSAMSHEIRTPMNTVIGMTRLALQSDLSPKQRNYLEKIDASAKTLLAIINDILDFSKIEAGHLELENIDFALDAVLENVAAVTAIRAEEKGLEIAFTIAADAPRQLRGDPLRLGQILINLVSNAIKFTAQGEVIVAVSTATEAKTEAEAEATDAAPARPPALRFSVRDTGIGLSTEQIGGLFRPFSQADATTARRYGGTGLGLAISRQLVERMGGTIGVHSQPARGSEFHFTLPLATAAPQPGVRHEHRGLRPASSRILIVDDNASARQILLDMVHGFEMQASAVDSGTAALACLHEAAQRGAPFDIVLMDWQMPGMDGLEAAARIRADHSLRRLPAVLMVTAYGREEVLQRVGQLGLQGLLIKPVTESVMFNTLSDVLGHAIIPPAQPAPHHGEPPRRGRPPRETFAHLAGRRVLVVDDHALNREVACDFLAAIGIHADTATDGEEALQRLHEPDQRFDVVLMDVHMPNMDGLTATRALRGDARFADLPIVALTAQARVADRQASLAAGMTAHLTKPIDETALYRTLNDLLAAPAGPSPAPASAASAASAASPTAPSAPAEAPVVPAGHPMQPTPARLAAPDLDAALARLGGDPARLHRLLHGFARDFSDHRDRLDKALASGGLPAVAAFAHLVKGAAAYLGARDFCATAECLEFAARGGDALAAARHAPLFSDALTDLLTQINAALATSTAAAATAPATARSAAATAEATALQDILATVLDAIPLVARGDYAAQAPLVRIAGTLAEHAEAAVAAEALRLYEDLDLEESVTSLRCLAACLRTRLENPP